MQPNDLKEKMKGVFVVQITPFNQDGSLDLEGMRINTRWLVERMAGKDFSFVPEGSNGEFYAQSEDEWKAVAKAVVEEVNGRNPVIIGTAQAGTQETIKRCQYAQSIGADGALVVLPYYHIPVEEGMYQHYKQIAESVDIGIMLYNNPFVSGCWVRPALMAKLAKIPNFIGVKENSPSILGYYFMQNTIDPKDAVTLCGLGEEVYPFFAMHGCPGFVSFFANFAPEVSYSMYEAAMAKDYDKLFEVWASLRRFFKLPEIVKCMTPLFPPSYTAKVAANHGPGTGVTGAAVVNIGIVKAAMDMLGLRGGEVRSPLIGITEEEKAELHDILKDAGIIK